MKQHKVVLKARLILYNRGRILLLKQTKPNGGNYTLVGGTVEAEETARRCVIRESYEEAGLILNPHDLKLVHVLQKVKNEQQRITLYFKAQQWSGQLQAREKKKFKSVEWFDLEELPLNITPSVLQALKAYRRGIIYSELQ